MIAMKQFKIDTFLLQLSEDEKKYLIYKLKEVFISNISQAVFLCPCCSQSNFIKHGSYKGTQKYKCKTTSKIFTFKSQTVLSGITKQETFEKFLEMLSMGFFPTIRDLSKRLKISMQTAFDWRTKVITALYSDVNLNN